MFREIPIEAFGFHSIVRLRDIDAVVNNYMILRALAEETGASCGVVLKGDVHGVGMKDVAPALYTNGARLFFIEDLVEGIELRKILPKKDIRIYVMAGLLYGEEEYFEKYSLIPCLNSINQIGRWNSYCYEKNYSAVIHLDTYMNRIGLLDDDVKLLSDNWNELTSNISIDFYMSHLSDIKKNNAESSNKQLSIFKSYLKILPPAPASLSCTDGMASLNKKDFNLDIVRPGIGLVGGGPNVSTPISSEAMHAMEVYAKISQVKKVKKGAKIGYGGKYTATTDMRIALVHIGYKDGYLSSLSEVDDLKKGAYMYLKGYRLPVVGRISLGVTTVDVTHVPEEVLDQYKYVEVLGPNVDVKFLADLVGCYEVLMALGRNNIKVADYTLREFVELYD